jgi:hypothetical protein
MERATLTAIESPGSDWDRIDDLLAGIAGLSKSDTSAEEFFGGDSRPERGRRRDLGSQ